MEVMLSEFESAADEISGLLAGMLDDNEDNDSVYYLILSIVASLRTRFRKWLRIFLQEIYKEAAETAIANLEVADSFGSDAQDDLNSLIIEAEDAAEKEFASILSLASQFRNGKAPSDLQEFSVAQAAFVSIGASAIARSRIRSQIRDSLVRIVGSDGKLQKYSMAYFIGMVLNRAEFAAKSRAAILGVGLSGGDLVQVSLQPSTIGDFCDAYRGSVYSISGKDPTYPHVSVLPGGGCPLHIHCHHFFIPYTADKKPREVPKELLELGPQASSWQYQQKWDSLNG